MDNILYLAVIFFCGGVDCQVVAIDDPYPTQEACEHKLTQGERLIRQQFPNLTVVKPLCLSFKYGVKT
jgi:hypothetical protein